MIINDLFTDVNGTLLQAHVGPTGETWTSIASLGEGNADIQSNQTQLAAANTGLASRYRWNLSDTVVTCTVTVTFTFSNVVGSRPYLLLSARDGSYPATLSIERLSAASGSPDGTLSLRLGDQSATTVAWADDGLAHTLALETNAAPAGTNGYGLLKAYIDGTLVATCNLSTAMVDRGNIILRFGQTGSTGASPKVDSIQANVTTFGASLGPAVPTPKLSTFAFLTFPRNKSLAPGVLGPSGGLAPPIEGQLWPRGQKSG